jgi:DNA modification methylase
MKLENIINKQHFVDTRVGLDWLPPKSVQCIVTSPPYYSKRDYGVDGQIGLEDTPELFLREMMNVFRKCYRVLKDDGLMFVNIGDGWWGGKGKNGQESRASMEKRFKAGRSMNKPYQNIGTTTRPVDRTHPGYKAKDLVSIPWRMALAAKGIISLPGKDLLYWTEQLTIAIDKQDWPLVGMCRDNIRSRAMLECIIDQSWYLRNDIIWAKPNVQPESAADRFTCMHEYVFMFSKSRKYKFNAKAIAEPSSENTHARLSKASTKLIDEGHEYLTQRKGAAEYKPGVRPKANKAFESAISGSPSSDMRNARDVWIINTEGSVGGHTATYPESLPAICMLAATDPGDLVCDPFSGEGTTLIVAKKLKRSFIGFELNPKDCKTYEVRHHNNFAMGIIS